MAIATATLSPVPLAVGGCGSSPLPLPRPPRDLISKNMSSVPAALLSPIALCCARIAASRCCRSLLRRERQHCGRVGLCMHPLHANALATEVRMPKRQHAAPAECRQGRGTLGGVELAALPPGSCVRLLAGRGLRGGEEPLALLDPPGGGLRGERARGTGEVLQRKGCCQPGLADPRCQHSRCRSGGH